MGRPYEVVSVFIMLRGLFERVISMRILGRSIRAPTDPRTVPLFKSQGPKEPNSHLNPSARRPLSVLRSALAACLVILAVVTPAPAGPAHTRPAAVTITADTFRLSGAEAAQGKVIFSDPVNGDAPGDLTARAEGSSVILLSWSAPPVWESPVLSYRIEVREEGADWSDLVPTRASGTRSTGTRALREA